MGQVCNYIWNYWLGVWGNDYGSPEVKQVYALTISLGQVHIVILCRLRANVWRRLSSTLLL